MERGNIKAVSTITWRGKKYKVNKTPDGYWLMTDKQLAMMLGLPYNVFMEMKENNK